MHHQDHRRRAALPGQRPDHLHRGPEPATHPPQLGGAHQAQQPSRAQGLDRLDRKSAIAVHLTGVCRHDGQDLRKGVTVCGQLCS